MKKNTFLFIMLLIMTMLIMRSDTALAGARYGFILWYNTLLPTLLPFMILSNIIIKTNTAHIIGKYLQPVTKLLKISKNCGYPIVVGLLCGYPMGAYVCARLNEHEDINNYETNYLSAICNNVSPMFMTSYICISSLKSSGLIPFVIINMLAGSLVSAILLRNDYSVKNKHLYKLYTQNKSSERITLRAFAQVLDDAVNSSLTAILKLCAYVIIFSIISCLISEISFLPAVIKAIITAFLEITSGIAAISSLDIPLQAKYILILTTTAFGGLSSIFQTASLTSGSSLSIKKYIQHKIVISLVTMVTAIFVVYVFKNYFL